MVNLQDLLDWICDTVNNICDKVSSFFEYGEQIVVGVSGGADSMALIHCLYISNKNFQLIAAHLNHGLRGEESDSDEMFVSNWCKERGIRFVYKRLDIGQIAKKKHISIELSGRNERYKFFNKIGGRIATAHTLSDRVETMIFNMTRGTGTRGLCSTKYIRDNIVRPLLFFTRAEIEQYCKLNGVAYRNDSSNDSDDYTRNKIRHHVVAKLKSINPHFENHVGRLLDGLVYDEEFLTKISNQELKKAMSKGGIDVKYVNSLEYSIKIRVIDSFLKTSGVLTTYEMLMRVMTICKNGCGKQSLPDDKFAAIHRGILYVESKSVLKPFDILLPDVSKYYYKDLYFVICDISQYEYFLNITQHLFLFMLDYGKILGDIHIHSRHNGDKLKLLNRPTKTVKSLIQESGITNEDRDKLIFLSDDRGLFWAKSFGPDVRVLPDKTTKKVILIFELTN